MALNQLHESFTFVVYHTALSKEGVERIGDIYEHDPAVEWKKRWETFERDFLPFADRYIDICFRSIQMVHPACQCVVLTDEKTSFKLPKEIQIIRYALDCDKPAYMRLLAQLQYLKERKFDSPIVFLDYDMLVQHSLSPLLSQKFDIALICEPIWNRIEGAFLMIRQDAIEKGILFLSKIEENFKSLFSSYEAWGGVEAALNSVLKASKPFPKNGMTYALDEIRIQIFPGDKYNFPVPSQDPLWGVQYLPEKMMLHFRGENKQDMLDYWNTYLQRNAK